MKKTIYVHIGHFKTGTTSLQQLLFKYKSMLSEQGMLYPLGGATYPYQHGELLLACARLRKEQPLRQLLAGFLASDHEKIFFSSEALSNLQAADVSFLINVLSQYGAVCIIYVLRDWVSYLPSRYQQNIMVYDDWHWGEFIEASYQYYPKMKDINYSQVAETYSKAPLSAFKVFFYHEHILLDILRYIDAPDHLLVDSSKQLNRSVDSDLIELKRVLNAYDIQQNQYEKNARFYSLLDNRNLPRRLDNLEWARRLLKSTSGELIRELIDNERFILEPPNTVIFNKWQHDLSSVLAKYNIEHSMPNAWLQAAWPSHHRPSKVNLQSLESLLSETIKCVD